MRALILIFVHLGQIPEPHQVYILHFDLHDAVYTWLECDVPQSGATWPYKQGRPISLMRCMCFPRDMVAKFT